MSNFHITSSRSLAKNNATKNQMTKVGKFICLEAGKRTARKISQLIEFRYTIIQMEYTKRIAHVNM